MKCIAITEYRENTEQIIVKDDKEKTIGGLRVHLNLRFTPTAPTSAKVYITFKRYNAKNEIQTKTETLQGLHVKEPDLLSGYFDLGQQWNDEWGGDFTITANSYTISIDVEGDTDPNIIEIEQDQGPQYVTLASNQQETIFWQTANYHFPSQGNSRRYVSSAIPDKTDAAIYTITTDDHYLMPNIYTPTIISETEYQLIEEGTLDNEQANGTVFLVTDTDGNKTVRIFLSNSQRNYTEQYTAHDVYRVSVDLFNPVPINLIDNNELTIIDQGIVNPTYDHWGDLPNSATMGIVNFTTEINTEIQTHEAKSNQVYLNTYDVSALGTNKHVLANDIGYIVGGIL